MLNLVFKREIHESSSNVFYRSNYNSKYIAHSFLKMETNHIGIEIMNDVKTTKLFEH